MWKQAGFLYHAGHPVVRGKVLDGYGKVQGYPEMLPDLTNRNYEYYLDHTGCAELCRWSSLFGLSAEKAGQISGAQAKQ